MARKKPDPPPGPSKPEPQPPRPEMEQAIRERLRLLEQQIAGAEPLLGKLSSEHISVIIAHAENQSHRRSQERLLRLPQERADRRDGRIFWGVLVALGLFAFIGLWIASLAYEKPDLVLELIKWLGGLFGGLVGGYGLRGAGGNIGARKTRHSESRAPSQKPPTPS